MNFTFTEEQLLFESNISDFLNAEISTDRIRNSWETESGRDAALWKNLAGMGLTAMLIPEEYGGLALNETDFVLIAQACGRVALTEPLVESVLVVTPILTALASKHERCAELLAQLAAGEIYITVGNSANALVSDAHVADWLLLPKGDEIHLLARDQVNLTHQESLDPSRKLFTVDWQSTDQSCVCRGQEATDLLASSFDRGALGVAAQLLGLAETMVAMTVKYTTDREQFGKPIGSYQALKHSMADCAVKIEFAKAPLYRAAHTLRESTGRVAIDVAQAKVACSAAALLAAKNCIQAHGAMGYTWECDLHIFMKRAWALDKWYGDNAFHKNRLHAWLLDPNTAMGADKLFG